MIRTASSTAFLEAWLLDEARRVLAYRGTVAVPAGAAG